MLAERGEEDALRTENGRLQNSNNLSPELRQLIAAGCTPIPRWIERVMEPWAMCLLLIPDLLQLHCTYALKLVPQESKL